MVLLRTSYIGTRVSSSIILNRNLVRFGIYMVKRCQFYDVSSPKTPEPPPEKYKEKASTPTFEKFSISSKIVKPLGKMFNFLEVTSSPPPMRKS